MVGTNKIFLEDNKIILLKDSYGEIGEGFIHVHHIIPVSRLVIEKDYKINPIEDLIPVCPNCH